MNVQEFIVDLERSDRHINEMSQQGAITWSPGLEFGHGLLAALIARRIRLGLVAGRRVEACEVFDRDGWLFRIRALIDGVEIDQIGLLVIEFCHEVAHLEPPVAEMGVACYLVAEKTE